MDAQPRENFFEITVSQEGSDRIMRLFKTVKWLFGASIVMSAIIQVVSFVRLSFYLKLYDGGNFIVKAETVILPIYSFLYTVLLLGQIFSFFHFTRLCKKSILLRQADLFNYSFKWLIRSATFSIIMLVLEFLMSVFTMYALINYLSKMPPA
jgi:hypothetical protein